MKFQLGPSHFLTFSLLLLALCLTMPALASDRGEGPLDPSQPTGITVDAIIQQFAAKEKQFKIAREQYTYRQDVMVETLEGDTPARPGFPRRLASPPSCHPIGRHDIVALDREC